MPAQRIHRYLDKDPALQRLTARVNELKRLEAIWRAAVPAPLSHHSAPCNWSERCLSIVAEDSATACKLQQMSRTLVIRLQSRGLDAQVLLVRIGVFPTSQKPPRAPARAIGGEGRKAIAQAADALPPGNLRNGLLRLLKRS